MKRAEKIEIIIATLSANENYSVEDYKGNLIFTYTKNGFPIYGVVKEKASKLTEHYRTRSIEHRDKSIERIKSEIDSNNKYKEELTARLKGLNGLIKTGDVLYSSWGYEQTNVNFYKVLERKNDTVLIVEIAQTKSYDSDLSGTTTPNADKQIGQPFKKRITKYGDIKIDTCSTASQYDGKKVYWSAYY